MKTSDLDHEDTARMIGGAMFWLGVLLLTGSFAVGLLLSA